MLDVERKTISRMPEWHTEEGIMLGDNYVDCSWFYRRKGSKNVIKRAEHFRKDQFKFRVAVSPYVDMNFDVRHSTTWNFPVQTKGNH